MRGIGADTRRCYEYEVGIVAHKPDAMFKGAIRRYRLGLEHFKFRAPNYITAYSTLRRLYLPDDPRPLRGGKDLPYYADEVAADPRDVFVVCNVRTYTVAALTLEEAEAAALARYKYVAMTADPYWRAHSQVTRVGPFEPPDGVVDTKPLVL
jgi:hypothetical protein